MNGIYCIFNGFIAREPELKALPSGQEVLNLSVAVKDPFRKGADGYPQTIWVRLALWGKQAEIGARLLTKGKKINVHGTLQYDPETGGPRVYATRDGGSGASFEVNVSNFEITDWGNDGDGATVQPAAAAASNGFQPAAAQPAASNDTIAF